MKNSDQFVGFVKGMKKPFCWVLLVGLIASILFCLMCLPTRVNANETGQSKPIYTYKTETGWAVHKSPPDQFVKDPLPEWKVSVEDQKKLISGEKGSTTISYKKDITVLWNYIFPLEKTVISEKEITFKSGVFISNDLETITKPILKVSVMTLGFLPFVITLGGFAGVYSRKKKDNLLILKVFLAFTAVMLIPWFGLVYPESTTFAALLTCLTSLVLAVSFFCLLFSKENEGENFVIFCIFSFLAVLVIIVYYDNDLTLSLYFSFFYFFHYFLAFLLDPKKSK